MPFQNVKFNSTLGRPNVGEVFYSISLLKVEMQLFLIFSTDNKDRNFGYASIKEQQYLVIDTGGVGSEITEFSKAITEQALIAVDIQA